MLTMRVVFIAIVCEFIHNILLTLVCKSVRWRHAKSNAARVTLGQCDHRQSTSSLQKGANLHERPALGNAQKSAARTLLSGARAAGIIQRDSLKGATSRRIVVSAAGEIIGFDGVWVLPSARDLSRGTVPNRRLVYIGKRLREPQNGSQRRKKATQSRNSACFF